jgi:cardiolipin synthase
VYGYLLQEGQVVVSSESDDQLESGPDHSHDIYTVANIITVLRLIMVPFFFAVFIETDNDVLAFVLFAVAGSTDWIDGQIARRTGTVTEIGKAIDPLVDRLLLAAGVLGLYLVERLPLWLVLVLLARDLYLLAGAYTLAHKRARPVRVVFVGKLTTAVLLFGFSDLILNWPILPGIRAIDSALLPGMGGSSAALGIWFVYIGTALSLATALIYTVQARASLKHADRTQRSATGGS